MENKNILVTGGAGYIGSHTCKLLAINGYRPIVVDNLYRGHRQFVKWGPLEVGDIRSRDFMEGVFKKYQPEAVIHFAGLAYVEESIEKENLYFDVNVNGTENILSVMKGCGCKKIIFSSSCAVYGEVTDGLSENTTRNPINPYGESKKRAEDLIERANDDWDLRYVVLRYFNAVGADPDGEIGEFHVPETHLFPRLLESLSTGQVFNIYGNDYKTVDGTCVRDFVHVMDLALGHIAALKHIESDKNSIIINLGTGCGVSILELIRVAESVTNSQLKISFLSRRNGDPSSLVAIPRLAKSCLGWVPIYSLEDKIHHAWIWLKKMQALRNNGFK